MTRDREQAYDLAIGLFLKDIRTEYNRIWIALFFLPLLRSFYCSDLIVPNSKVLELMNNSWPLIKLQVL